MRTTPSIIYGEDKGCCSHSRLRFQLQLFFPDRESGHLAVNQDREKCGQLCGEGVTRVFAGRTEQWPGADISVGTTFVSVVCGFPGPLQDKPHC